MKINFSGLPTPWPIILFSFIITFLSYYVAKGEIINYRRNRREHIRRQLTISKFTKFLALFALFRSVIGLIGSFNSLRVYGITGFQYPELSSTIIATIIPASISFFNFHFKRSVFRENFIIGENLGGQEQINLDNNSEEIENYIVPRIMPKIVKFIIVSGITMSTIGLIWNFVALGIVASFKNFPKNSQFITNCTEIPQINNLRTIVQCHQLENNLYQCYLGIKGIWILDIIARSFSFLILTFCLCKSDLDEDDEEESSWTKILAGCETLMLFLLIFLPIAQTKGLDITGLEVCDLDSNLLFSRTGYISEWFQQELNTLKQISLI